MLSVEQLYVNYGEKEILHDVDLQVAQEEIVMIVGESGSGKSTLVRSIMGLLGEEGHITKGNIVFQGVNLCMRWSSATSGRRFLLPWHFSIL